jgi:hypothetical protein
MEMSCLENHFVLELYSARGFPLEEENELGYQYNKGIISRNDSILVLYIFLFLLII